MHLMAFYRWCLFAESTAASSVCATTYILLHHHDGLFIINMILSISANTSSFQRRKHHHQDQHDWWHCVCNRNWESCNLYSLSSVWALPCSTLLSMKCAIYPQSIAPTQNTTIIPTVGVDCTHHHHHPTLWRKLFWGESKTSALLPHQHHATQRRHGDYNMVNQEPVVYLSTSILLLLRGNILCLVFALCDI